MPFTFGFFSYWWKFIQNLFVWVIELIQIEFIYLMQKSKGKREKSIEWKQIAIENRTHANFVLWIGACVDLLSLMRDFDSTHQDFWMNLIEHSISTNSIYKKRIHSHGDNIYENLSNEAIHLDIKNELYIYLWNKIVGVLYSMLSIYVVYNMLGFYVIKFFS